MTVRVHGGVLTNQALTGSLRFFKISSTNTGAFANSIGRGKLSAVPVDTGASYSIGDVITFVGGTGPVDAEMQVTGISTIATQTETDFVDSFTGGAAYNISDVITLNDGSTITVDAVSGGEVTQFTITTASTNAITQDLSTLTQASVLPVGGSGFTLTLGLANQSVFELTTINSGQYTVFPTNPVSTTTDGDGTGLTLTATPGLIVPGAFVNTGTPLVRHEFFVADGYPVPNSAADRVLKIISEKCTLVQISLIDDDNIHIACENTSFGWDSSLEMQTVIQSLGVIGSGSVDSFNPPVPNETIVGTTVDLSAITVTEVTKFELA